MSKQYDKKELSDLAGISPNEVWRNVRRFGIEPKKSGRALYLTESQKDEYLLARSNEYNTPKETYDSHDVATAANLQPKHVWDTVRLRGIQPNKAGRLYLTKENLDLFLQRHAAGYVDPEYSKKRNAQKSAIIAPTPRKTPPTIIDTGKSYRVAQTAYNVPKPWDWAQSVGK